MKEEYIKPCSGVAWAVNDKPFVQKRQGQGQNKGRSSRVYLYKTDITSYFTMSLRIKKSELLHEQMLNQQRSAMVVENKVVQFGFRSQQWFPS